MPRDNGPIAGSPLRDQTAPGRDSARVRRIAALSGLDARRASSPASAASSPRGGIASPRLPPQLRVRLAKSLLAQGMAPVRAAVEAGFYDQSHLARQFTRHLDVAPGAYAAGVLATERRDR